MSIVFRCWSGWLGYVAEKLVGLTERSAGRRLWRGLFCRVQEGFGDDCLGEGAAHHADDFADFVGGGPAVGGDSGEDKLELGGLLDGSARGANGVADLGGSEWWSGGRGGRMCTGRVSTGEEARPGRGCGGGRFGKKGFQLFEHRFMSSRAS